MPMPQKMRTFQEPVAGQNLVVTASGLEYRRVVTDSLQDSRRAVLGPAGNRLDPLQQGSFPGSGCLAESCFVRIMFGDEYSPGQYVPVWG